MRWRLRQGGGCCCRPRDLNCRGFRWNERKALRGKRLLQRSVRSRRQELRCQCCGSRGEPGWCTPGPGCRGFHWSGWKVLREKWLPQKSLMPHQRRRCCWFFRLRGGGFLWRNRRRCLCGWCCCWLRVRCRRSWKHVNCRGGNQSREPAPHPWGRCCWFFRLRGGGFLWSNRHRCPWGW